MANGSSDLYHFLCAFQIPGGNAYSIFCNPDCSRYMPVVISEWQKDVLAAYSQTGDPAHSGVYRVVFDVLFQAGMALRQIEVQTGISDGKKKAWANIIIGYDEDASLSVNSDLSDSAVISAMSGADMIVPKSARQLTIVIDRRNINGGGIVQYIFNEVFYCEKCLDEIRAEEQKAI